MRDDRYLVLSADEAGELGDLMDKAIPHMEGQKQGECVRWACDLRTGAGVCLRHRDAEDLLNTLYSIYSDNTAQGPDLHLNAMYHIRQVEHALETAGERITTPQRSTQGPGR
jgi:hypothetical protein